jgi:hypothetical protein
MSQLSGIASHRFRVMAHDRRGHVSPVASNRHKGEEPMPENKVHGFLADKFSAVRDAFEANFASGADVGASCCATLDGESQVVPESLQLHVFFLGSL